MSAEEVNTNPTQEHQHGENCQHDHEDEKTSSKGEKKVKKALSKLGMTKVEGVNRVTLRQKDNYILIVKDPEVYTSQQTENTFIIFGELTIDDPDRKLAKEEIERMKAEGENIKPESEQKKETIEVVDDNEELSEEGLSAEMIETIISETKCSRQRAIKALRKNNGDLINSILDVNN